MKRQELVDILHGILDEQFIDDQSSYDLSKDDIEAVREDLNSEIDKLAVAIRGND